MVVVCLCETRCVTLSTINLWTIHLAWEQTYFLCTQMALVEFTMVWLKTIIHTICDRIDVRIHTTYEWICSIILWHHVPIIYPRAHNTHYTIYYVIVFLFLSICHDALLFFFYSFNDFPFATESACPCRCSTLNTHFKLTHIRLYANVYLSYRWLFGCTRLSQSRACAM